MTEHTGVHALVRRTHEERVLDVLRRSGPLSRAGIAERVGLSRTTLSQVTGTLLARRAVVVVATDGDRRTGSGRPAELLALDPASGQYLGVDLGHRRVTVAVADASHDVIAQGTRTYPTDTGWGRRVRTALALVDRLGVETGVHYDDLQAVGVGLLGPHPAPGATGRDEARDVVERAFGDRFGAPVLVDNNTRLAALAEAVTSSTGATHVLYARASEGVGGGLVVDGRLLTGASGVAGEIGHIRVAAAAGRRCRCGDQGCLETVAALPAVLDDCRARGADVTTGADLAAAVRADDRAVVDVVDAAGDALGVVLSALATALDPSEVVVGGDLVRAAPRVVDRVTAALRGAPETSAVPPVRPAALGDEDGALGALAALFHRSPLLAGYAPPRRTGPHHDSEGAAMTRTTTPPAPAGATSGGPPWP